MSVVQPRTGTPIVWRQTGGDESLDLSGASGNSGGVTVGSYHDWGDRSAAPAPDGFLWELEIAGFEAPGTIAIGDPVQLHLTRSQNTTRWSGPEAPSPTATTTGDINKLNNLGTGIGSVKAISTTLTDTIIAGGQFNDGYRYWAPVLTNRAGANLLKTANVHILTVTPFWYEVI